MGRDWEGNLGVGKILVGSRKGRESPKIVRFLVAIYGKKGILGDCNVLSALKCFFAKAQ